MEKWYSDGMSYDNIGLDAHVIIIITERMENKHHGWFVGIFISMDCTTTCRACLAFIFVFFRTIVKEIYPSQRSIDKCFSSICQDNGLVFKSINVCFSNTTTETAWMPLGDLKFLTFTEF